MEKDGTFCILCGKPFSTDEVRHVYWWVNGHTVEKSYACNGCYHIITLHNAMQTEEPEFDEEMVQDILNDEKAANHLEILDGPEVEG